MASERIRDKIVASKAKGMWMGGCPPLGYDIKEKKLIPNQREAELVRFIFEKYLEVKSLINLREAVNKAGLRSKRFVTSTGKVRGDNPYASSMLARILRSQVYIGRIELKSEKESFKGQHKAIIDRDLFDRVQTLMDQNQNKHNEIHDMDGYLLSGKLFDNRGNHFKNQSTSKNSLKKYRYYHLKGKYLPVGDLEELVVTMLRKVFRFSLGGILPRAVEMEFRCIDIDDLPDSHRSKLFRMMISKVIYFRRKLIVFISLDDLAYLRPFQKVNFISEVSGKSESPIYVSQDQSQLVIEDEFRFNPDACSNQAVGQGKKMITVSQNNLNLVKALSIGWRYRKMLTGGMGIKALRKQEKTSVRTIYKYFSLNYLSPRILKTILEGTPKTRINLQNLFEIASKYSDFEEQEKAFFKEIVQ